MADQVLHDVPFDHTLLRRGERLLFSVLCGRSETFTLTVELTPAEAEQYRAEGAGFLSTLAGRIQGNPERYDKRAL